jgi:gag-polypeptide of LTR copia-type
MDIHEHLNKLMKMRQELAGIGTSLNNEDFTAIIILLPPSYNTVTTSIYIIASIMMKQQVSMEDIS